MGLEKSEKITYICILTRLDLDHIGQIVHDTSHAPQELSGNLCSKLEEGHN